MRRFALLILCFAQWHFNAAVPVASSKNIDPLCTTSHPADIVFVLDSSGSISIPDFHRQINFVTSIINQFALGPDQVHVGVVSFSNWAQPEYQLRDPQDKTSLEEAIRSMVQMRGDTNTASALAYVQDVMLTSEYGARPHVPHVIIVLTDGNSNDQKQTAYEAERAKKRGNVQVFAVGVGSAVDRQELINIASQPADQFVLTVRSYAALGTIKELLAVKTCKVTISPTFQPPTVRTTADPSVQVDQVTISPTFRPPTFSTTPDPSVQVDQACGIGVAADIVFAGSPSADANDTLKTMQFFQNISSRLDIGPDKVHVSLVPKDCDFIPEVGLGRNIKRALRYIQRRSLPSTASVLRYIKESSFAEERGGRPHVKRIGLVVIDGPLDQMKHAAKEAIRLREEENVEVFVVGVGKEVQANDLKTIASAPADNHVYHVTNYDELQSIVNQVTAGICPVSSL